MKTDFFTDIENKIKRFNAAENKQIVREKNESQLLQEKINSHQKAFEEEVVKKFNFYKNPVSKEIEEDEISIVKAYKLFISLKELNTKCGDEKNFISFDGFTSPLLTREIYINGDDFIYLKLWFIYVNGAKDFVPVLEKADDKAKIKFVPFERYEFNFDEKEVLSVIQKYKLI